MVAAFAGDSTITKVGTGSVDDGDGFDRLLLIFTFAVGFGVGFEGVVSFFVVFVDFVVFAVFAEMEVVVRRGQ